LWHDLTTLAPYAAELAARDPLSIKPVALSADAAADSADAHASEAGAYHVLASVTGRAQRLFALLGARQLDFVAARGHPAGAPLSQRTGVVYDALFSAAREDFIATSDTALRALLAEFRDHALISTSGGGSTDDVLWIPLRKDELERVLEKAGTS